MQLKLDFVTCGRAISLVPDLSINVSSHLGEGSGCAPAVAEHAQLSIR